jgi:hypothetical protein
MLVSVGMAAPVNPNDSSAAAMQMIVSGSSVYMYSPFYFLTAKLKLLPKHIIMCIINPAMCDDSPPIGYVAPASETKVPYSETPVGQPPHADIFDTNLASSIQQSEKLQSVPSREFELASVIIENKQNSIPDVRSEIEVLISQQQHSSTQVNLENVAAQQRPNNFEIPAPSNKAQREESKVEFNVPHHRVL